MIDTSKFIRTLDGKVVAVFGLGASNMAVIHNLVKHGANIIAWDDNESRRADAAQAGAKIENITERDLSDCACLVLAPGVPLTHPEPHDVVKNAKAHDLEIICDIEILHRSDLGFKTIGITGTNGKSTTTTLIGYILNECGMDAVIGGNIGVPVLSLDAPRDNGAFVLELSSFQLDLCPTFTPDIAVLMNITPDHIDRHGTIENYAASKARMFQGNGHAIIDVDDKYTRAIAKNIKHRTVTRISMTDKNYSDLYVDNGVLYDGDDHYSVTADSLKGAHNHQNAALAFAVTKTLGIMSAQIMYAMKSFPGLQHRQYKVCDINNVVFINDSKATNADATSKALSSFPQVHWIVGGVQKDGGLSGLEVYRDHIEYAYLIGESVDDFKTWCETQNIPYVVSNTIEQAVMDAYSNATSGDVVLLSPACASFDQYKNFEARGLDFIDHVMALPDLQKL